jgi:hypothetical protein
LACAVTMRAIAASHAQSLTTAAQPLLVFEDAHAY